MDKKEVRDYMGSSYHYKPEMNPQPGNSSSNWFQNIKKPAQPLLIRQRQDSISSDTSATSPVGSPQSPILTDIPKFTRQNSKNMFQSFNLAE